MSMHQLPRFLLLLSPDDVHQSVTLVILGDFNARVGVFHPANGLWHGTIGRHGIAETLLVKNFFSFVNRISSL